MSLGLNSSNNIPQTNLVNTKSQSVDIRPPIVAQPAMRSASFTARLRSPPTSPPPPPIRTESSKKYQRRERPASVIPTQDYPFDTPIIQPPESPVKSPVKSPTLSDDYDNKLVDTVLRSPLKNKDKEANCSISPRPLSASSLSPKSPHGVTKSLDESNKENLSGTSDSLSSLSSPSSPSKQKTEDEKQEEESNEKHSPDSIEGKL